MTKDIFKEQVLEECKDKQNIFIFVSRDDEVDTKAIINKLLEMGKTVVVPVCSNRGNKIILSKINNINDLKPSLYEILEPRNIVKFPKQDIDVFFVPGTKFDNNGNRKGRGKGYFDRFLEDLKGKKLIIGLCFENQVVENIEINQWDIPVDKIITK